MSSKTTVALGEICDVRDGTHESPKGKKSGHPLVTSKHIKNGSIGFSSANLISTDDFEAVNKRSKVDKYDVLISMIGTVGELVFVDKEPEYAIKNIGLIKTGGNALLGNYLYYYLKSPQAVNHLSSVQAGSTQKFIGLGELRKFPIELWDEISQQEIVKTLGDLDRKIELNRRMNETLERMGQALFKKYFVDNPESENWKSGKIGDLFGLTMGLSPKGDSYNKKEQGVPLLNGAADFKNGLIKPTQYTTEPTRLSKNGDIIFCIRGTIGNVTIGHSEYCLGRGVAALSAKKFCTGYVYFHTKGEIVNLTSSASGSVIRGLSKGDISGTQIKIPPDTLVSQFDKISDALLKEIHGNDVQIETLKNIRDSLLPKLMSGQIKV